MQRNDFTLARPAQSALATNTVLRNTYLLLGMTLLFSAITAGLAMISNAKPLNPFITLIGYFGLLFVTSRLRESSWGLAGVFALTGFMGYTLGPILNLYLHAFVNGHQIVLTALGSTGLIFFALSGYALVSRKDFSFMAGFVMVGILVAFLAGLGALIFHLSGLSLVVSAMFVFLSSAVILIQTSQIIHGGETNYIMATITLYVSLYNIFISLLNLLGAFSGERE
jgi:modulator of FtsH protease